MATITIRLYEDSKGSGVCGARDPGKGCGAALDWYGTLTGKHMPMNAGAVPLKSEREAGTMRVIVFFSAEDSHWNTCPERKQFSRDGK